MVISKLVFRVPVPENSFPIVYNWLLLQWQRFPEFRGAWGHRRKEKLTNNILTNNSKGNSVGTFIKNLPRLPDCIHSSVAADRTSIAQISSNMILTLPMNEMCADSLHSLPYTVVSLADENENLTLPRFVKNLEGYGFDLEPLPLFSPPCFDTLRAVSPSIFELHSNDETLEATPASGEYPLHWLTSTSQYLQCSEDTLAADIQSPSTYDVVCSRAKQFYDLPGSQRFRKIVRASIPAYSKASTRRDKSAVIASIIDAMMDHPDGGAVRFLKYDKGRWSALGAYQIRDKVGHALRETIQEMARAERKKMHSVRQMVAPAS